ncbi:MAG: hypothetical protein DHS20C16_36400 [Phycisphaerae bacterium]|nr:MAG: hypothetical protein DHS20C16_36400 [Phycisphaerae bacterium]
MSAVLRSETAVAGCIAAVRRGLELIEQMDDETSTIAPEDHGAVGEHLRHCVDHFDCFFRDVESGTIDYESSVDRELVFLSGHMVHDLALMVLIAERTGAGPSTELGVAYSTATFRAGQTA